jgi:DNA modification methylase
MDIKNIAVKDLIPYEKNTKKHDDVQINNVAESIKQYGFVQPIVIDKNNVVVIGHCRLLAAKKLKMADVPCVCVEDLTEEQVKALRIVDNKSNESPWDFDFLADELAELDLSDFEFDFGIDTDAEEETEIVEDEAPEVDEENEPITKLGDIWQLGRHRLMCGDSTDKETVELLMNGNKADMVFTDPPYGMKKEADGVLNDNLNYDDLLEFNKKWIPLTFANTKENGSWYCWGIDEPLMDIYSHILKPMQRENKITFRNFITWKKENDNPTMLFNGACSSNNRSYYTNEKCLFVMCGVQGFNNNKDHYDETFEAVRSYLEGEAKRVNLTSKLLTQITGVQMYGHWFTKSQFTIIPEVHYKKLQEYYNGEAFCMDYNELKNLFDKDQHETLKEAVMAKRAYFDGTASQCIDVWVHDVTSTKERELCGEHATPKPISLCSRAIKTSSRENEIVLDVFGGSGSTLIACEQTDRICYMCELSEKYCDVIIKRWETLTGDKAVKIN